MIVGAYWSVRKESKESATARVIAFLTALSSHGEKLSIWYDKGWSRAEALRSRIPLDAPSIAQRLTARRRDIELGFSFYAWNGSNSNLSATIGCYNERVRNAVVLSVGDDDRLSDEQYRAILEEMVRVFDPDHAVVTSRAHLAKAEVRNPWDGGRFTYHRGGKIEEHAFE